MTSLTRGYFLLSITDLIHMRAYKNWTIEEENKLKELVSSGKYSYAKLTEFFPNRSAASLNCHSRQYLNIYNLYKQHKYTHDTEFFKIPNIHNSYVAGFLAADGCIRISKKQSPVLVLSLATKDENQLIYIKNLMKYSGVIYKTIRDKSLDKLVTGGGKMSTLQISVSEDYIKYLSDNFGVIPQKTYRLQPPMLSFENKLAYLIGLIDGDGFINIVKNRPEIQIGFISSSVEAVKWIKEFIDNMNLPSLKKKEIKIAKRYESNSFTIRYQGGRAIALIKLVQSFKNKHNLQVLNRKWDNDITNNRIKEYEQKYLKFQYNP